MKVLNVLVGLIAAVWSAQPVQAQFADQPIRIVFPFPAGGSGDTIVRLLADSLHEGLGRRSSSRTGPERAVGWECRR